MAKSIYNLPIDIKKEIYDKITVKQEDTKSRYLNITLTDNSLPIDLTGHTVKVFILKPDQSKIFNNVKVLNPKEGKIEVELTTQALLLPGDINLELVIYGSDSSILSSKILSICIEKKLRDDKAIESTNEFRALGDALTKLGQWEGMFQSKYDNVENNYKKDLTYVKDRFVDKTNPVMNSEAVVTATKARSQLLVKNDTAAMRIFTENNQGYIQSGEGNGCELTISGHQLTKMPKLDIKADRVNLSDSLLFTPTWNIHRDGPRVYLQNRNVKKTLDLMDSGILKYDNKDLAFLNDIVKIDNPERGVERITIANKFVVTKVTRSTSSSSRGTQFKGAWYHKMGEVNSHMNVCLGAFGNVQNGIERVQITCKPDYSDVYIVSNVDNFASLVAEITFYGLK
ncbi:BppU family phage baseplate upper protein [Hathewaya histolytica]|uniref:BppU family phage baseplate upper protein n=1 Tax=Hathewaya histolytica TaxID=1498 RepID=UPI003B6722C5